jgi:hypothetical protein
VAVLVEECGQLCGCLGKSIATAKAGKRPMPCDGLRKSLAITKEKFSMTNSQLKGPKSWIASSPTAVTQKSEMQPLGLGLSQNKPG